MEERNDRPRFLTPDEYAQRLQQLRMAVAGDAPCWHALTPYAPARPQTPVSWTVPVQR